jgi:hypothetical protein
MKLVKKNRPLIENYLLIDNPNLMIKLKGKYRISELKGVLATQNSVSEDFNLLGTPPHR